MGTGLESGEILLGQMPLGGSAKGMTLPVTPEDASVVARIIGQAVAPSQGTWRWAGSTSR